MKKILFLISLLLILPFASALKGSLDNNEIVEIPDLSKINDIIVKFQTGDYFVEGVCPTSCIEQICQISRAYNCLSLDLNNDGFITTVELEEMKNYIIFELSKQIPALEMNGISYVSAATKRFYEIEISSIKNTTINEEGNEDGTIINTLTSLKEANYIFKEDNTIKLLYNEGDLADMSIQGRYLYNPETKKGYLFGDFTIDAKVDLSETIGEIINPYYGICVIDGGGIGCIIFSDKIVSSEGQFLGSKVYNRPIIVVGGLINPEVTELEVTMIYKTESWLIGNPVALPENSIIGGFGKVQGNVYGELKDIITSGFSYDAIVTGTSYNGIYSAMCYYVNYPEYLQMERSNCIFILESYIDYDKDSIFSDTDCNDNDAKIGTVCPTLTIGVSGSSGGGGGGGSSSACLPSVSCGDWSPCSQDRVMIRDCKTSSCTRTIPVTEMSCNYFTQGGSIDESPEEVVRTLERELIKKEEPWKFPYITFLWIIFLILLIITLLYYYRKHQLSKHL
ncbi:MAG: hypothetical protein WC413_01010 [Candidatus Nanoarchaeia archaeon]